MALAPTIVRENQHILSMAIRRSDGHVLAATDNHESLWKDTPANRSTATHVQVPIYHGDQQFGEIEICFTPFIPRGIRGFLHQFHLPLTIFMAVSGFIAYQLYLKKVLRHLDPASVVPDRVRAALDTLRTNHRSIHIVTSRAQIVIAPLDQEKIRTKTFRPSLDRSFSRRYCQERHAACFGNRVRQGPQLDSQHYTYCRIGRKAKRRNDKLYRYYGT